MNKNLKGGLFAAGKPKPLEPSEANISKSIEGFLNSQKIYNDRLNSGQVEVRKKYLCRKTNSWKEFFNWLTLCKAGTPDRMFIVEGRIYYVEVKMRGKKPSPDQITRHDELRTKAGAVVIVADSIENFILQFNTLFPDRSVKVFSRY